MFKNYSENRFNKKFPNLKQVINENPIDFKMTGQVPLRYGPNQVYLLDVDERRTVYTEFTVDNDHTYGLKIVYNYPYIIEKIRKPFLTTIITTMIIAIIIQLILTPYFKYIFIVTFFATLLVYYYAIEHYVSTLGISAYKVDVVMKKK